MRLRGEDSTGGARLSILIYTQIITSALFIAFFHYSSALFPGKRSPHIKPSTPKLLYFLCSAVPPLRPSLCGIQPLKCQFAAAIASLCHILLLSASQAPNPSITFSCVRWFHIFLGPVVCHYVSLSVFMCLCYSLPLPPSFFVLQAEVLDSQRRSTGLNDGLVNGVTDNSAN